MLMENLPPLLPPTREKNGPEQGSRKRNLTTWSFPCWQVQEGVKEMSQKLFGWCCRAVYANFGGLLCYHRGNNLNPKALLVQRSLKETGCDYSEGLRASISLKDWKSPNSLPLLPPLCQLFLAFFSPPKYTSYPKTLPNAEKYSILRIFISLYFISHVSHDFSLGFLKMSFF